jgi:hypothetical protein
VVGRVPSAWTTMPLSLHVAEGGLDVRDIPHVQRRSKTSSTTAKSTRVTKPAISFVVRPLIASVDGNGRPIGDAQWTRGHSSGDPPKFVLLARSSRDLLWRRATPHCTPRPTSCPTSFAPQTSVIRAAICPSGSPSVNAGNTHRSEGSPYSGISTVEGERHVLFVRPLKREGDRS